MKKLISSLALCAFVSIAGINAQTTPDTPGSNSTIVQNNNDNPYTSHKVDIKNPLAWPELTTMSGEGNIKIAKVSSDVMLHVQGSAIIGPLSQVTGKDNNFRLAVDGKVVAKEVVVRIDNWADYVFTNNYKLMPLKDLKKYLATNQHLPGMDAAKEVEDKGLNLGEMQKKQMEKTEELYLYLIQLSEQVEQLKTENAALKEEMQHLKK